MKKNIGMAQIIEISYFARTIARYYTTATPSLTARDKSENGTIFKVQGRDVRK